MRQRTIIIMCIVYMADRYGVVCCRCYDRRLFCDGIADRGKLLDEIYKFMPSEIICNEAFYMSGMDLEDLKRTPWHYHLFAGCLVF